MHTLTRETEKGKRVINPQWGVAWPRPSLFHFSILLGFLGMHTHVSSVFSKPVEPGSEVRSQPDGVQLP